MSRCPHIFETEICPPFLRLKEIWNEGTFAFANELAVACFLCTLVMAMRYYVITSILTMNFSVKNYLTTKLAFAFSFILLLHYCVSQSAVLNCTLQYWNPLSKSSNRND
jgi:hypothetical protein